MKNVMKRKTVLLLIAVALLLTVAVGGTVAYLSARTGEVKNTFEPANVVPEIKESFDGTTKKEVQIKNAGNVDAYIRVALIGNWCDADGNILKSVDVNVEADGWTKDGGYYYYKDAVPANGVTSYLIGPNGYQPSEESKPANAHHFQLEVLAQAIQAEGMGATSAQEAFSKAAQ